ncbi:MAG TPA: hypothetical protein VNJ08_04765 [Bacteriovoracaceae bacterium]|nr:hypothetical protein [Bacteriovoracaceae bacterium]
MKILILFFLFIEISHAKGLYLMAGGGINASTYNTNGEATQLGGGINLKTDLGYFFDDHWSLEWSSSVKFNRVERFTFWDTLMTIGPRYQFGDNPYYLRAFFGRAPTVIYLDDAPEVIRQNNSSRIQLNGLVYGLAVGENMKSKKDLVWFYEFALSYQELDDQTGLRNDGDVPVVVYERINDEHFHIVSLLATIGVRVF